MNLGPILIILGGLLLALCAYRYLVWANVIYANPFATTSLPIKLGREERIRRARKRGTLAARFRGKNWDVLARDINESLEALGYTFVHKWVSDGRLPIRPFIQIVNDLNLPYEKTIHATAAWGNFWRAFSDIAITSGMRPPLWTVLNLADNRAKMMAEIAADESHPLRHLYAHEMSRPSYELYGDTLETRWLEYSAILWETADINTVI